jgi:enterochelin esterase-like enzyme
MMSSRALQELLANGPPGEAAIQAFLTSRQFPIVEGSVATVVWHGAADEVRLRHWLSGLESDTRLQQVDGSELWHLSFGLPRGSRVEYKLEVRRGSEASWIRDPLNPHSARDPFGENSVVEGEGYSTPLWTLHDDAAPHGEIEPLSLASAALDAVRGGWIYLPAHFSRSRRYPLMIVHDGSDYRNYASFTDVLDNLIHRREVSELIVAGIDSPDRLREYPNHEGHARFVAEELLPHLQDAYPLATEPHSRGLMGASFGAVAAFSIACRYPGKFGRLLLQSGSFAFTDVNHENRRGPLFEPVVAFMNQYRAAPRAVTERIYLSCGVYESLIYENRALAPLLERTGMAVRFEEARDGHNWVNWRDRMRSGLSWLFPGPQTLIYE